MRTLLFASLAQKGQRKVIKVVECCLVGWALTLSTQPAQAQDQASTALEGATISLQAAPAMAASLLAETVTLADDERLVFLSIDLNEGWKTYWRLPGRFGLAPVFDWEGSDNLAAAHALFPEPELFDEADGQSIGYATPVLWPVIVRPESPDRPVHVQLDLEIGLCATLCLPERLTLSGTLDDLASGPQPPLARLFELAEDLPGEPAPLNPAAFTRTNDMLRIETGEPVQDGAFAVAENEKHHALLLPADRSTVLTGRWPHDAPPTRLTLVFGDRRMQIVGITGPE